MRRRRRQTCSLLIAIAEKLISEICVDPTDRAHCLVTHNVELVVSALSPIAPNRFERSRTETEPSILIGNVEDNLPLPEERSVGGSERILRVIDACCFRGYTVQFYDLEISALPEGVFASEADVVTANIEAGYRP